MIVVDYLQLARGGGGRREENRQQEIAEISRGLKALAKDLKLPIIAVSQLNREVEKREGRPKLSDLRESGAIEQDADLILFIHREDMSGGDGSDTGPTSVAELIIGKHRNGATGAVKVTFIKEYTRFENYADEGEGFGLTRSRVAIRAIILVADGVGCGGAPDAADYGDAGADTLGNLRARGGAAGAAASGSAGAGAHHGDRRRRAGSAARGAYGTMTEASAGKDTITGHWEMAGLVTTQALPTFPERLSAADPRRAARGGGRARPARQQDRVGDGDHRGARRRSSWRPAT